MRVGSHPTQPESSLSAVRSSFWSVPGPVSAEAAATDTDDDGAALGTLRASLGVSFASSGGSIEPQPAISSAAVMQRMEKVICADVA